MKGLAILGGILLTLGTIFALMSGMEMAELFEIRGREAIATLRGIKIGCALSAALGAALLIGALAPPDKPQP